MITAHHLKTLPVTLGKRLRHQSQHRLAYLTVWLDPLSVIEDDLQDEVYYEGLHEHDEEAVMLYALCLARRYLPRTYCTWVMTSPEQPVFKHIETLFRDGLQRAYPHIEIESLYDIVYGIPLPFCGLDVTSPEFLHDCPEYVSLVVDLFDIPLKTLPAKVWRKEQKVIDEQALTLIQPIVHRLIGELIAQDRQPFADLALLLMFLFSCTGNSLLDFSLDEYWDSGFEPVEWSKDMLERVNDGCLERDIVLTACERAMHHLESDSTLKESLKQQINCLKKGEKNDSQRISLQWSDRYPAHGVDPGTPGVTDAQSSLVFVRRAYGEGD